MALIPSEAVSDITVWDKANHFIAFLVLCVLLYFCFNKVNSLSSVIIPLLAYGLLLELLQGLTIYRFFSWFDLVADVIGIVSGIIVAKHLEKSILKSIRV